MTAAEMAAIHAAAFADSRPWSEAEIAALLVDGATAALSQPGGFALVRAVCDEAELLTLAVHPAARRQGLGRSLLEQTLAAARARGAERLFLEVDAANHAARALYARAGLTETGRRKGYYRRRDGSVSDALVLSLDLTAWESGSGE